MAETSSKDEGALVEVKLENNLPLQDDECCSSESSGSESLREESETKEINTLTKIQSFFLMLSVNSQMIKKRKFISKSSNLL